MEDNLSFYERQNRHDTVRIIGVPVELGSDERGLAAAPQYMLDNGLEKIITHLGSEISGVEMIPCPQPEGIAVGSAKYLKEIAAISNASARAVAAAAKRGETVITIGGDHSMAIGTISGAASVHRSLGVIYIDAHPDINTPEITITGNIHGMTTAALMGFGDPLLTSVGGDKRKIAPENFLFIGLKDMDQAEIEFLRRESLATVTMLDIAERGLSRAILAVDALRRKVDTVWISMDMDSIDEEYAPGVGLAMPGGLTRREVLGLAQYIGKTCNIAGFDLVEMSPGKDVNGKTARLAIELTARFLGTEYSWYQNEYIDTYRVGQTAPMNERAIE